MFFFVDKISRLAGMLIMLCSFTNLIVGLARAKKYLSTFWEQYLGNSSSEKMPVTVIVSLGMKY
jgi:hypothetical protein